MVTVKVYKVQMHHESLGWRNVSFVESKTKAYCDGWVDCMDSMYPSRPMRIICIDGIRLDMRHPLARDLVFAGLEHTIRWHVIRETKGRGGAAHELRNDSDERTPQRKDLVTVDPKAEFELTQEGADAINALLPTCKYVVGIRKNETGEVRFCAQHTEWLDDDDGHSLWWWSTGNMSCDCNRERDFRRAGNEEDGIEGERKCGEDRFTVIGIWFPDGDDARDLWLMNDF